MKEWTIGSLLETAAGYFREKGSSSPRLDAELLLADVLGVERINLYTEYDRPLSEDEVDRYRELTARRGKREPVAYILGRAHFRHLSLQVNPAVLIPRPETEELVDLALGLLRRKPLWEALTEVAPAAGSPAPLCEGPALGAPLVADVGCGSGAIALSVARESGSRVLALEVSPEALAISEANARSTGLSGLVEFRQADLLAEVPDASLRLVISNPPYVAAGDIPDLEPDVKDYEPLLALQAGPEGLDVIRRLLPEAARVLVPGGTLLMEIAHDQAEAVVALAEASGFTAVVSHKDLSGKQRFVEATLPGCPVFAMEGASAAQGGVPAEAEAAERATQHAARMQAVGAALKSGAVVGLPTDTVYGLAAAWNSKEGVRRLFDTKGRGEGRPVAVIFPSVKGIIEALPDLDETAMKVLDAFLPGPYTFVVETHVSRPNLVGTEDSLGVRVSDHPALLDLLESLGTAIAATSANLSGQPDAACVEDVDLSLLAHCSVAFGSPAGTRLVGVASTVVDLRPMASGEAPKVLREGAVAAEEFFSELAKLDWQSVPKGVPPASDILGTPSSEES